MQKHSIAFTLLVSVLLTACTDGDARLSPLEPGITTASAFGDRPSIGLGSSVLSSQTAADARCPEVPPFFVPFALTVGAGSDADVALDAVRLRFADVVSVAPPVVLLQPSLTTQFGSTVVSARSCTFPFVFRFGCGSARRGTLIIIVDARVRGRITSTELRATVE